MPINGNKVNLRFPYITLLLSSLIFLLVAACNPTRKINEGEFLLEKNVVVDKDTKLDKSEIENYIKQKPNHRSLVFFRSQLWFYNHVNEQKIKRKRENYNIKLAKKNARRMAKGKRPKQGKSQLFGEKLLEVGEAPVKLDTLLTSKSAKQIKLFLNNKGYFISSVSYDVHYRKKTATVIYKIKSAEPYTINKVDYKIPDSLLGTFVIGDTVNSVLIRGNNYDVDALEKERDRVTSLLNNNGYYFFTSDYIYYEIDTNIGNKKVNIILGIKNFVRKINDLSDSVVESTHQRFYIDNIYIQPDFISKKADPTNKDTLTVDNYKIIYSGKLNYKTRVLLGCVFIRKGALFKQKNVDETYKRLTELKAFKSVNIFFTETGNSKLDCHILLSPILKQSFAVELEGTNRASNLGIGGSFIFQNRNLLKGAEVFEFKLKGGIIAQNTANDNSGNVGDQLKKITQSTEFSPEMNIYVPRFLLPFQVNTPSQSNPKTVFTGGFIYINRPNILVNRTLNFSFGYTWKTQNNISHTFNPTVINFVKAYLDPAYKESLESTPAVLKTFRTHLTPSTSYSIVFNNQDVKKKRDFTYFKLGLESSGNLLRGFYNIVNKIKENAFVKDAGSYTFLDIPYSQYLRAEFDFRYYHTINANDKIVFRMAGGMGHPLTNFKSLPFERSFYSGGPNGMRAWRPFTLGPGSYADTTDNPFNFGDGQLEGNIEYRVKLFKNILGAIFIDAGNVWMSKPDPQRPGAEFNFDKFYKEIAIGSGLGIRYDFTFAILRIDLGLKIRDPQFVENDRWVIRNFFDNDWKDKYHSDFHRKYKFINPNFSIGYPF